MRRLVPVLAVALSFGLLITACDSGLTGPTETSNSEQSTAAAQQGTASQHGAASQSTLAHQLNTVREVTKKYKDIEEARADGYVAVSPYVPGMGFHFADGPPFGTELENPGVLVYYTNGNYNPAPGEQHDPAHDDDLILGAVEWLVPGNHEVGEDGGPPPNIFADEDSPRNLKVTEEHGWHYEDPPEQPGFTGLHAWVHRGNPEGVFHHTNPTIE